MANPIFGPRNLYIGYQNKYYLGLPRDYIDKVPPSYTRPLKDVLNPRTEYHTWYEETGKRIDTLEQRRYIIENILNPIKANDSDKANDSHEKQQMSNPSNTADKLKKSNATDKLKKSKTTDKLKKSKTTDKLKKSKKSNSVDDSLDEEDEDNEDEEDEDNSRSQEDSKFIYNTDTLVNTSLPKREESTANASSSEYALDSDLISALEGVEPASAETVFINMGLIRWLDKDEGKCSINNLRNITDDIKSIYLGMKKLADELYNAMKVVTGALDDLDDGTRYDFLFHVIAKGETMYYQSIADPEFATYLLDQCMPLHECMKCMILNKKTRV